MIDIIANLAQLRKRFANAVADPRRIVVARFAQDVVPHLIDELENRRESLRIAMAALHDACVCDEPLVRNPPTDWKSKARIPHHTDCPLYAIELPDPGVAPMAYADAVAARGKLLRGDG